MKCFYYTALTNAIRIEEVFYSTYYRNCDSSGFDSGEEKVVLSCRGEAVASLKQEKLVFTGRAEPEDCNF
jgi:hypothetical protein